MSAMTLAQLKQSGDIVGKDLYTYSFDFPIADLTAGASNITQTINIENDSYFLWLKATYFARINNTTSLTVNTQPIPLVTFQWRDTSSSQQIFNIQPFIANFWGRGELPMILPEPKMLEPRTSVSIDCTNVHATDAYQLILSMVGIKLFV